jgi:hypothetical protein
MKSIQKLIWGVVMVCLLVASSMAQQTSPQAQNQADSRSFVYKHVRMTVTKKGVVAGDLRTGKVIWRDGFWESPKYSIIVEDTRFFGEYLFVRYSIENLPKSASLKYTLTGKVAVDAADFYLKEDNVYYFDGVTLSTFMERNFAAIVIQEFNATSKVKRWIAFEVDQRIKPDCHETGGGAEFFKFVSKKGSIWVFGLSTKNCDVQITFNGLDTSKFSIDVKRK